MDVAYDQVQEASYPDDDKKPQDKDAATATAPTNDLKSDFQQAYDAVSKSPWAASAVSSFGSFWSKAKQQGGQYLEQAQKDYAPVREQAASGFSSIVSRARGLSLVGPLSPPLPSFPKSPESSDAKDEVNPVQPESLPADILKEARGMFSQFQSLASERLKGIDMKKIEQAEDAADEALLKFGTNIRNFLRDAVTIAPPEESADGKAGNKVLFESKDAEGKRVIHTTRFDAQLHVIHSSLDSFLKDPVSPQWEPWAKEFKVNTQNDAIAKDLEKHEDLRKAHEKLVPEKVESTQFWTRYYFLRHVIESEEKRRREMLQASASTAKDEEVGWDSDPDEESEEEEDEEEDSDSEEDSEEDSDEDSDDEESSTPQRPHPLAASKETLKPAAKSASSKTPAGKPAAKVPVTKAPAAKAPAPRMPAAKAPTSKASTTKPAEPRKSGDQQSQADSDASYDLVSGATSRTQGSPQGTKKAPVAEESDEDDWE